MRRAFSNWRTRYLVPAVLAATAVLLPQAAFAQIDQGRITGTVRDASGAVVPGATVVIKNDRTGEERTTTSGVQGLYLVPGLRASNYSVRATLAQFSPASFEGVLLSAGQELTLDLSLLPAGQQEAVTVSAEAPLVDLSSARMGSNVNQREVSYLPINGRQLSQLYLQAPGALNSGTGTFSDIRFSGRAVQQNIIRFDGIEGSAIIDASPGNLNGEIPSPFKLQSSLENVQEFRVDSNNYPAEYGTGTGGQITVVTRSGGNAFHGSAFEFFRDDALDSPNAFDPLVNGKTSRSALRLHQFGASVGGPLAKDKAFFFLSYEGYRLDSGINFVEAVPSNAARARAVPAVQPLFDAFRGPGAIVLQGASANPDFDILQLQSLATVREDSFSARLDTNLGTNNHLYLRYFRDKGTNDQPEGVTGRRALIESTPQNAVAALQSTITSSVLNELKIGYNRADTAVSGIAPTVNGIDLSQIVLNITGSVANTGIAGQGSASGVAIPGGLLRQNSATNGRGAPYKPYSLSLIDNLSLYRGSHFLKVGGELRLVRLETDRLGGTTYTYANLADFLANRLQSVQYLSDLSSASPFNGGVTGMRHAQQNYYIGYVQDEWKVSPRLTLNLGLRYDYYTPLSERDNLAVVFDPVNGRILPPETQQEKSKKDNFQPRVAFTWSPSDSHETVVRGGFGILVGPGQMEDLIQPVESDRISITSSGGTFPANPTALAANFLANPNNRSYQPRAYMPQYTIPEKVYQYTASLQQKLPYDTTFTAAYVGSKGRNLFLRSVTNQIVEVRTNPNPTANAIVIRQFDIVNGDSVQRPFAEVDVKTSGGKDSYNALQLSLNRRVQTGLTLNAQYTFSKSYGNSAGSNEAQTVGNNAVALAEFDYDNGYNRFDVRHAGNLSAVIALPFGKDRKVDLGGLGNAIFGDLELGAIVNARSGLPIDVLITRPDISYRDAAGNIFNSPAAGRTAIINTPGGGASRNVRRPDVVPGVSPYITDGGLLFLNPAAFTIPAPGTFGNLKRGDVRGPSFKQVDLMLNKRIPAGRTAMELRFEVFNIFNTTNYANPSGRLNPTLGTGANQVQPGQPLSAATAGTAFGRLTSTVGSTVGLGTNRQIQLAARFSF